MGVPGHATGDGIAHASAVLDSVPCQAQKDAAFCQANCCGELNRASRWHGGSMHRPSGLCATYMTRPCGEHSMLPHRCEPRASMVCTCCQRFESLAERLPTSAAQRALRSLPICGAAQRNHMPASSCCRCKHPAEHQAHSATSVTACCRVQAGTAVSRSTPPGDAGC